ANPVANKVFVLNRNGGAMIDSTNDSFTPLALPFIAYDAVVNSGDGRVFFVGDKYFSFSHGIFVVDGNSGQLITSRTDFLQITPRSAVLVPEENMLYVGTTTQFVGFDVSDLSAKVFPPSVAVRLAYDPANAGKLFLLHDPMAP